MCNSLKQIYSFLKGKPLKLYILLARLTKFYKKSTKLQLIQLKIKACVLVVQVSKQARPQETSKGVVF